MKTRREACGGENREIKCQILGTVQKCQEGEEEGKSVIPQCQRDNFFELRALLSLTQLKITPHFEQKLQ